MMVNATRDQFFKFISWKGVEPKTEKTRTLWVDGDGEVIGISTPGYMAKSEEEETWMIQTGVAETAQ